MKLKDRLEQNIILQNKKIKVGFAVCYEFDMFDKVLYIRIISIIIKSLLDSNI